MDPLRDLSELYVFDPTNAQETVHHINFVPPPAHAKALLGNERAVQEKADPPLALPDDVRAQLSHALTKHRIAFHALYRDIMKAAERDDIGLHGTIVIELVSDVAKWVMRTGDKLDTTVTMCSRQTVPILVERFDPNFPISRGMMGTGVQTKRLERKPIAMPGDYHRNIKIAANTCRRELTQLVAPILKCDPKKYDAFIMGHYELDDDQFHIRLLMGDSR